MPDANAIVLPASDWVDAREWADAPAAMRRAWLDRVAGLATAAKLRELRQGLGIDGQPLARVQPASRPDGATGPPLSPHRPSSRSQKWLRASVGKGHVTLWWSHGWGAILGYHARGEVRGAPVRDVIGLTPGDLARLKSDARRVWKRSGGSPDRTAPRVIVGDWTRRGPKPKPPPKGPPKPKPTQPDDLRARVRGKAAPVAREIVLDYVLHHQSAAAVAVREHGMAEPELLHAIEFEGLRFLGPRATDRDSLLVKMLHVLAEKERPIPPAIARHTREVVLTVQGNRDDAHWRRVYGQPDFAAGATGGDGKVVVYHGQPAGQIVLSHEMGHNLATGKYGSTRPTDDSDFGRAVLSGEPVPTEYGKNSRDEDFADSVREWFFRPDWFARVAPRRFAVIDRLAREADYGG